MRRKEHGMKEELINKIIDKLKQIHNAKELQRIYDFVYRIFLSK